MSAWRAASSSDGQMRFVWIADLLPDAAALPTAAAMRLGLAAIKETLESRTP